MTEEITPVSSELNTASSALKGLARKYRSNPSVKVADEIYEFCLKDEFVIDTHHAILLLQLLESRASTHKLQSVVRNVSDILMIKI